jgi:hypothetical protein
VIEPASGVPSSPAEFEAAQQRLQRSRLEGAVSVLGRDGLAWLALAPTWTQPLATAVSFPTGTQPLSTWLDAAERTGLVERESEARADPDTGREFWMGDGQRADVLEFLRTQTPLGERGLRALAAEVAARVRASSTGSPGALAEWCKVAIGMDDPHAQARELDRTVSTLAQEARIGEARAAVDAADQLAKAVGGPLQGAARLGARRLELAYRQASDARHLRYYFSRRELEAAFDELLSPRSPSWALHFLGIGGVGKTMLMRRITAQIAKERRLAVSRIDFDHLSPDYPLRRPGELLLALAQELRPFATSGHSEALFGHLSEYVLELHEVLAAEPPAGDPLFNVRRGEFERLLREFCDLLRTLPEPVVLLLDTCEELARIPVVNDMLPAVEATFHVLERVHAEVPSVRVVFAGRRPLASSGLGWTLGDLASGSGDPAAGLRRFLPARPFLMLREIRGFTRAEAGAYLAQRWGSDAVPSEALQQAILTRSRQVESDSVVHSSLSDAAGNAADDATVGEPDGKPDWYNPFDLALYAGCERTRRSRPTASWGATSTPTSICASSSACIKQNYGRCCPRWWRPAGSTLTACARCCPILPMTRRRSVCIAPWPTTSGSTSAATREPRLCTSRSTATSCLDCGPISLTPAAPLPSGMPSRGSVPCSRLAFESTHSVS